jgi:hypothetical protein
MKIKTLNAVAAFGGSFAMSAAIRRASSFVSNLAAERPPALP